MKFTLYNVYGDGKHSFSLQCLWMKQLTLRWLPTQDGPFSPSAATFSALLWRSESDLLRRRRREPTARSLWGHFAGDGIRQVRPPIHFPFFPAVLKRTPKLVNTQTHVCSDLTMWLPAKLRCSCKKRITWGTSVHPCPILVPLMTLCSVAKLNRLCKVVVRNNVRSLSKLRDDWLFGIHQQFLSQLRSWAGFRHLLLLDSGCTSGGLSIIQLSVNKILSFIFKAN